jgi:hypothetical protein
MVTESDSRQGAIVSAGIRFDLAVFRKLAESYLKSYHELLYHDLSGLKRETAGFSDIVQAHPLLAERYALLDLMQSSQEAPEDLRESLDMLQYFLFKTFTLAKIAHYLDDLSRIEREKNLSYEGR